MPGRFERLIKQLIDHGRINVGQRDDLGQKRLPLRRCGPLALFAGAESAGVRPIAVTACRRKVRYP
jgi:hypothetical protein